MKTTRGLSLAVISDCPLEHYLAKGYDYLIRYAYYNALGFFDHVHFFEPPYRVGWRLLLRNRFVRGAYVHRLLRGQAIIRNAPALDKMYSLHLHQTLRYDDVKKILREHRVDCIRIYEMFSFDLAARLSEELSIPLVVSIH